MQPIADRRLAGLGKQRLHIEKERSLERPAAPELLENRPRVHPERIAGNLHDGAVRHRVASP